jgi:hypothetical protein
MSQPEFLQSQNFSDEFAGINRIVEIGSVFGTQYFKPLVQAVAYDPNNEKQRRTLNLAYDGLPKQLSEEEAAMLGIYASTLAQQEKPNMECNLTEVRVLRWLGSAAANRDETTQRNVSHILRHDYGLRGMKAALSLWYDRTISH